MEVDSLLDGIVELQPDNPDKIGTLLSLKYSTSDNAIFSNNNIFQTTISTQFDSILTSSFNIYDSATIFNSYSSSYVSYLSGNSITSQTKNLLNSQKNVIPNLFTNLKTEAGSMPSYISVQNDIVTIPFNNNTINGLISCSLGITGTEFSTDDLETLTSGRMQFVKDMLNWVNNKINSNNLFYYYNVNNIKLNHSDDDGFDSTYAQLKTENQYNFYDQNYEQQSILADEKLLPGILHQILLYKSTDSVVESGSFYSPENPLHFALKQLYGNDINFTSNNLSVPTINYTYYPNIDGTAGEFVSSFYSNWNYINYSSGSYSHTNNYQPINEERTKLNNLNIHIDLTNRGTGDLYTNTINNYLIDQAPFYSKVSFGIPKQTMSLLNYTYDFTNMDKLVNNETVLKTIYAATMNNLYIDGQVIDESKLVVDSQYTTSSININLLKFFKDNFNTSAEEVLDCSDTPLEKKQKLKIGKDTGEVDEIFSSLGNNSLLIPQYNLLNDDEEPLATFLNVNNTGSQLTNYNRHITATNRNTYQNGYIHFLASSLYQRLATPTYLFTKIAKYEVTSDGTETLIQNFYFDLRNFVVNNPTDDITYTFYDNQIHSNKRYKYVTSQIIIVPALAYGYTGADVVTQGSEQMYLNLGISYIPIYKMIEVPQTTESDIVVLEKPPVTPRVLFHPILNKKNQILIEINPSGFDKIEAPISIEDADVGLFEKALESQNSTELLSFSKDFDESGITEYEIFRTMEYPSSYTSFSNNKITTVEATNSTKLYTDVIEPNTTYYYCIRSKNFRGLPSNPTKVYKIVLVEDGQFYTLQQDIIEDLQTEDTYIRSAIKNLKRFLYISPSVVQKNVNSNLEGNAEDAITDFALGTAESEVWGKKFKIRVRSKSSGKTIDFNITFNKNNKGEFVPE